MRGSFIALTARFILTGGGLAVAALPTLAAAQSAVPALAPDPALVRMQERLDALEREVRDLRGDNERLQFELAGAQEAVRRLEGLVDRLLEAEAERAVAPSPPPPPSRKPPPPKAQKQSANPQDSAPLAQPPRATPISGAGAPLGPTAPASAGGAGLSAADAASPVQSGQGPEPTFNRALQLMFRGDYAAAETAFGSFLETYADAPQAPDARYWLGQALLAREANEAAARQFLTVVRDHPAASRAPDALAYLGVALSRMGNKDEACRAFSDLRARYPRANAEVRGFASRQAQTIGCTTA